MSGNIYERVARLEQRCDQIERAQSCASHGSTDGTVDVERSGNLRHSTDAHPYSHMSPFDIAESWYNEADIARCVARGRSGSDDRYKIPTNVYSEEFARWLTDQYRLAMAKGVQLARTGR